MFINSWFNFLRRIFLILIFCVSLWVTHPLNGIAEINTDRYDGNIFVVYAGNGSLVPSRLTLKQSFERELPVILVYYLDDNSDSKEFAFIVSRFQEFYGRAASIIPVNIDTIPTKEKYQPDEVGYYYQGAIPQTVVLNQEKEIIFDQVGQVEFEEVDDILRDLFNLLPRSKSVELKKKTFNEFNSELVPQNK